MTDQALGAFLAKLLEHARIILGDLDLDQDHWWIELRPRWTDSVRLRYLTPADGTERRWIEWQIRLDSIHMLEHDDQANAYIDRHLRDFKQAILGAAGEPA
jgi:hypothetical protein